MSNHSIPMVRKTSSNMQQREYEIRFDGPCNGFTLSIHIDEKRTMKFSREDRRWRIVGWHYCKSHVVATALFDLIGDDNQWKVSEEEFEAAVDWADDLASILDKAAYSFTEYVRTNEQRAKKPRVDFFGLRADEIKLPTAEPEDKSSLYLMRHANGLTKIGKSVQPKAREKTLQAEDPRLEMIFCVDGLGHLENRLHKIFAKLRVRGEWFRLEDRHVDWIKFLLGGSI